MTERTYDRIRIGELRQILVFIGKPISLSSQSIQIPRQFKPQYPQCCGPTCRFATRVHPKCPLSSAMNPSNALNIVYPQWIQFEKKPPTAQPLRYPTLQFWIDQPWRRPAYLSFHCARNFSDWGTNLCNLSGRTPHQISQSSSSRTKIIWEP